MPRGRGSGLRGVLPSTTPLHGRVSSPRVLGRQFSHSREDESGGLGDPDIPGDNRRAGRSGGFGSACRAHAMRVVLANSGHNHGYQTALALQEAGILHRFVTGIYYDRSRWRIRALEGMVRRYGSAKDRLRLAGRHQPGLVSRSVVPLVFAELIEQAWPTLPGLRSSIPISTITYMRNELFDLQVASRHVHDCDVFHGFEQCAKFSLRRARKDGATTILDEPIIHRSLLDRTEREVREQLGVPPLRRAPGYQMHVDRKYAELEVADYLFVGLRFVKDSYVAEGFPESRIVVIPYGADTSRFRPKDEPVRGGPLKILFVGQLSWFKGLHHLLAIFEALPVEATLTIIGSAHEEWRTYFEKRLSSMSRPVRYLHTVPSLAIQAHFAEADVFVFPSLVGGSASPSTRRWRAGCLW